MVEAPWLVVGTPHKGVLGFLGTTLWWSYVGATRWGGLPWCWGLVVVGVVGLVGNLAGSLGV